jgi:hypothetical protein
MDRVVELSVGFGVFERFIELFERDSFDSFRCGLVSLQSDSS